MMSKKLVIYFFIAGILIFTPSVVLASPTFSIYPSNGTIKDVSKGFTVDVLINSDEEEVTKARFAITYDPKIIKVVKASRNNSLFDQWPDDESTIDNTRGMVMLTGFTQSGGDKPLYTTNGDPDVMARLEFEVVTNKKENAVLNFEYSGTDELFNSVIMKDGSPPQNILSTRPTSATFTIGTFKSPSTAIEPSQIGVIAGIVLIGIGIFVRNTRSNIFRKRKGTVVLYE